MHPDLLQLQRYHETGDPREFQSLVQHHADMVFATARRVTCDPSLAEDVAQETFLELARKSRTITESVGAWLHRVAWRRACDAVRAETARQRYEAAAFTLDEGQECTWEQLEPIFDEALAELAPQERWIIVEHYLENRPQVELAGCMGVSQSTISRLLTKSIANLRAKLKAKGALCGAALGSMIAASTSHAAPPALIASLHKIGAAGIGSGPVATITGGSLFSGVLGVHLKVVIAGSVALAACAAGYDLASENSHLKRWFGHSPSWAVADPLTPPPMQSPTPTKERLLAEARAIWARTPRLTGKDFERLWIPVMFEKDVDKRFTALRAAGVTLSRAEYDLVVARHPEVHFADERKSLQAAVALRNDLLGAWYRESPLEAVAWTQGKCVPGEAWFPPVLAPWVRSHPDAWAAFVEAGPDLRIGEHARLWVEELDDPGSIWAKGEAVGMSSDAIKFAIFEAMETGAPAETLLQQIMRCPDAQFRSRHLVGLVPKLSSEQLLLTAASGLVGDPAQINMLRAMAGDPSASFSEAAASMAKEASGGGETAQLAQWSRDCVNRLYEQWLKVDPLAALQQSVRVGNPAFLDGFMREAANSPALNEAGIAGAFTSVKNRDRALTAYYHAKAGGDPRATLQTIIASSWIEDQIDAAKPILQQWTIHSAQDAAAWLAALPHHENHAELVAVVASQWAQTEPEAAFAFAKTQSLGLQHGWLNGLAWGARSLPEGKLAPILAALQTDPNYNVLLTRLLGYRCPSQPNEALALFSKYGASGWETSIVNDTLHWLEGDDDRAVDYGLALTHIDLTQVKPQKVVKAAQLLAAHLAHDGKLPQALDWTLRLPAATAPQARSAALSKVISTDPTQKAIAQHWLRQAPISQTERGSLLQQIAK